MISLISNWMLLDGCPPELKAELDILADKVMRAEPNTLMYLVNLQAPGPLDPYNNPIEPPPDPIPLAKQKQISFLEIYADEFAFSRHVNGPVFQAFLKEYGKYFRQDPNRPGWPTTDNAFFARVSGFIRPAAGA